MSKNAEILKLQTLETEFEAERAFLGLILLAPEILVENFEQFLKPEDFCHTTHGNIYRGMLALLDEGAPIEIAALCAKLQAAGWSVDPGTIAEIASFGNIGAAEKGFAHYAGLIRDRASLRRLRPQLMEILTSINHGAAVDAVREALELATSQFFQEARSSKFEPLPPLVKASVERIKFVSEHPGELFGISTGYRELNRLIGGFHSSDLTILAGRPAMGKTALALNFAINAAKESKASVGIFSLEMSKEQLVQRVLCSEARVNSAVARNGTRKPDEMARIHEASRRLSEFPKTLHIDDTPALSVVEMKSKARRLKQGPGLDLLIVDYLQLMRGTGRESREREVSEISQSLKAIAKELSIPVVALSQLNRSLESRPKNDRRPQLSDLRESGAIEQDADNILFVYRDEVYNPDSAERGVAEIIVGKQRNGPTSSVKLKFFSEWTRFENLTDRDLSQNYRSEVRFYDEF